GQVLGDGDRLNAHQTRGQVDNWLTKTPNSLTNGYRAQRMTTSASGGRSRSSGIAVGVPMWMKPTKRSPPFAPSISCATGSKPNQRVTQVAAKPSAKAALRRLKQTFPAESSCSSSGAFVFGFGEKMTPIVSGAGKNCLRSI